LISWRSAGGTALSIKPYYIEYDEYDSESGLEIKPLENDYDLSDIDTAIMFRRR
jgi:hypothetical protein